VFTRTSSLLLFIFLLIFSCRKIYTPPAIEQDLHLLSVDGLIYTGTGVTSTILISRSVTLNQGDQYLPELNAQVMIQSSGGESFPLIDSTGSGTYISAALNLDSIQQYRVAITTSDGNQFQSDYVFTKQAPPIDSLSWELTGNPDPRFQDQSVNIYINAHDSANSTKFYRWDYLKTFKHLSAYTTYLGVENGLVYPLPVGYSTHTCWSTTNSQDIYLGNTNTLKQDVVSHILVAHIAQNDPVLDNGCSFLFRQYPLSEESYTYWLNVQKNSQSLGGLFDLQPAQINGNMHCTTNPAIPVVGYISASSVQEKRIYISNKSLPGWQSEHYNPTSNECLTISLAVDPLNTLVYNFQDTSYGPLEFITPVFTTYLIVAPKTCMDCRYQGGINVKPAFWPQYD
jgi:hypothetical protein